MPMTPAMCWVPLYPATGEAESGVTNDDLAGDVAEANRGLSPDTADIPSWETTEALVGDN